MTNKKRAADPDDSLSIKKNLEEVIKMPVPGQKHKEKLYEGTLRVADGSTEKEKRFDKMIADLEEQYSSYFKGRKSAFKDEQDKISNYYMIMNENGTLFHFNWKKDTDLDSQIRYATFQIFQEIFGE